MNTPMPVVATDDLTNSVQEVFAQVTRYPLEILDPEANLEEELGIDSVKLGEVFSVLREQYQLPEKIDIAREQLQTIAGITQALQQYLSGTIPPAQPTLEPMLKPDAAPAPVVPAHSGNGHAAVDLDSVTTSVQDIFAQVTRYPLEILDPEAGLEEDLGIDSVKLGEVFSVLREQYQLPEKIDIAREQLQTIAGIAEALQHYLSGGGVQGQQAPPSNGSYAASSVNGTATSFAAIQPAHKPFTGKIAFITGSGRGLGKDIACYLAELGATVIVNSFHSRNQGIETAEAIKASGGDALHLWGSVANPTQLHDMFDQIEAAYGGLDFLIANASNGMLAPLKDLTVEHWEKAYRTNVIGLHQSALRAVELMKRRGGGKIITLSSPAAHGYVDYFGCMGTVKAAVESLTKSMAIEFSCDNIQVNCVSPGPIYGELLQKWPESERLIAQWEKSTAYERLCEARDVSHCIAYLLSEPVKLFTGSVLVMDGGISARGW